MNTAQARQWLDEAWEEALDSADENPDPDVDRLVNSSIASIRYALITQVIGKIADPNRSLFYLQAADGEPGAWNARSFCDQVIVPWVGDNHDVIGTSSEPYANKPLRRIRISRGMRDVRGQDWDRLADLFEAWDSASQEDLQKACRRCLAAIARRLSGQSFKYSIPLRISACQTHAILKAFLSEQSGGLRPMVVATALMRVLGEGLGLFDRIESQGVNEADAISGAPGDVMCHASDGSLILAVEVKDRQLTFADVRSSMRKTRQADTALTKLLFAVPGLRESERREITEGMEQAWASGLNLHHVDLLDFARISFVLLDEAWRPRLLREVGNDLDKRGDHRHRRAWHDLLIREESSGEQHEPKSP